MTGRSLVQAKALRVCCGAFRSTPIPALLVEMGEFPLRIRRYNLGLHYWNKLSDQKNSSAGKCLLEDSWEFVGKERKSNFLYLIKQLAIKIGLDKDMMSGTNWSLIPFWLLPDPEVYLHSFTDGSKDPESGKTGLVVYVDSSRTRQSVRMSDHLSIFSVELLAILLAHDWVEENTPPKSNICSDSAAALVALKEGTSRANPDLIWEILSCLFRIERSGYNVCFLWVPWHSGVEGNKISDSLAKLAWSKETVVFLEKS